MTQNDKGNGVTQNDRRNGSAKYEKRDCHVERSRNISNSSTFLGFFDRLRMTGGTAWRRITGGTTRLRMTGERRCEE
ncbi:MAG: hypothetical protein HFE28_08165 [Clostridia bacterium]|nr:hypothetical protein [Clostridia bacterium]